MPGKDGSPLSSGREPVGDPTNKSGATPPSAKIALAPKVDSNEHWGDLPIQVREVFRTEGGADLPPQYRDWIDGYYKKLLLLK